MKNRAFISVIFFYSLFLLVPRITHALLSQTEDLCDQQRRSVNNSSLKKIGILMSRAHADRLSQDLYSDVSLFLNFVNQNQTENFPEIKAILASVNGHDSEPAQWSSIQERLTSSFLIFHSRYRNSTIGGYASNDRTAPVSIVNLGRDPRGTFYVYFDNCQRELFQPNQFLDSASAQRLSALYCVKVDSRNGQILQMGARAILQISIDGETYQSWPDFLQAELRESTPECRPE